MAAVAQATSSLDVSNYLFCIGDQHIQYTIPFGRAVYYLAQEIILHSRNFLDCLQLPVLLSQQMLGRLKSPQDD